MTVLKLWIDETPGRRAQEPNLRFYTYVYEYQQVPNHFLCNLFLGWESSKSYWPAVMTTIIQTKGYGYGW